MNQLRRHAIEVHRATSDFDIEDGSFESGDFVDSFLPPEYLVIHEMVCGDGLAILMVGDRAPSHFGNAGGTGNLRLEAYRTGGSEAHPLWRSDVHDESVDELPDVSISMDSEKLYLASDANLDVRDGLTGRSLGDLALPGLDERIDWKVSQGAGLLAEETRASVFEVPA